MPRTILSEPLLRWMFLMKEWSDLDPVEREPLQVAQRGVSGAEVVQRDRDAQLDELIEDRQNDLVIVQQERLGDLDLQARGFHPRIPQGSGDDLNQSRPFKLDRRQIYRH
jgi:hypothetical protein